MLSFPPWSTQDDVSLENVPVLDFGCTTACRDILLSHETKVQLPDSLEGSKLIVRSSPAGQ